MKTGTIDVLAFGASGWKRANPWTRTAEPNGAHKFQKTNPRFRWCYVQMLATAKPKGSPQSVKYLQYKCMGRKQRRNSSKKTETKRKSQPRSQKRKPVSEGAYEKLKKPPLPEQPSRISKKSAVCATAGTLEMWSRSGYLPRSKNHPHQTKGPFVALTPRTIKTAFSHTHTHTRAVLRMLLVALHRHTRRTPKWDPRRVETQ